MAACAAGPTGLDGLDRSEIVVADTSLTVAVAVTLAERNQGLREVESLPDGVDGMLFVWDSPTSPTFGMRDVRFPLDVWWFDEDGQLLGSTAMTTCPDGNCVSYGAPGPVLWALETPAGEYDFPPGARLSNVENP